MGKALGITGNQVRPCQHVFPGAATLLTQTTISITPPGWFGKQIRWSIVGGVAPSTQDVHIDLYIDGVNTATLALPVGQTKAEGGVIAAITFIPEVTEQYAVISQDDPAASDLVLSIYWA